jgi:hypothetical protein
MNRTPGEMAATLVEEGLRLREFPGLEFRSSALGRQAYLSGTRLAVWQVALVARDLGWEPAALARHLDIAPEAAALAHAYVQAHPSEIADAMADNEAAAARLAARLPPDRVVMAE